MRIVEAAISAFYEEIGTQTPPPGVSRLSAITIDVAVPVLRGGWYEELLSERVVAVAEATLAEGEVKCPPILRVVAAAVAEATLPTEDAAAAVAEVFRKEIGVVDPAPGVDRLAQIAVGSLEPMTREQWEQDLVSERVVQIGEAALAESNPPNVAAVLRAVQAAVRDEGDGG
jgi:hypothetical protein